MKGDEYYYDYKGNMVKDLNKQIDTYPFSVARIPSNKNKHNFAKGSVIFGSLIKDH